jgi:hypothetical protein
MSAPYRDQPSGLHYVCVACYAHAAKVPQLCPACEVDLLPIDRDDVRLDLRAEAERRLQKKMYGEYSLLSLLGFGLALPALVLSALPMIGVALLAGAACIRAYTRLRPRSALGTYHARRVRLARELAGQPALTDKSTLGDDPELFDTDETLRWLGIRSP